MEWIRRGVSTSSVPWHNWRSDMPSTSPAQARLMAAAAHNPAIAEKTGVPQSVARDFNQADKRSGMTKRMNKPGNQGKTVKALRGR